MNDTDAQPWRIIEDVRPFLDCVSEIKGLLGGHASDPPNEIPLALVSRLSWKWRERSPVKITERTREEATEALHRRREGRHSEAAIYWTRSRSRSCVTNWDCSQRCSTAGRRSSSRTAPQPSRRSHGPKLRPNRNGLLYLEKKIQTKDEVLAELMAEHVALKKKSWGTLTGGWVPHDIRDEVVDFVRRWSDQTELGPGRFVPMAGHYCQQVLFLAEALWPGERAQRLDSPGLLAGGLGEASDQSTTILKNPLEGYRRLTFYDAGWRRGGGQSVECVAGC